MQLDGIGAYVPKQLSTLALKKQFNFQDILKYDGQQAHTFSTLLPNTVHYAIWEYSSRWSGICFVIYNLQFNAAHWLEQELLLCHISSGKFVCFPASSTIPIYGGAGISLTFQICRLLTNWHHAPSYNGCFLIQDISFRGTIEALKCSFTFSNFDSMLSTVVILPTMLFFFLWLKLVLLLCYDFFFLLKLPDLTVIFPLLVFNNSFSCITWGVFAGHTGSTIGTYTTCILHDLYCKYFTLALFYALN